MPIFITNFILPMALAFIRFYLYNPSKKYDGEILDTVKQSVAYLACGDTTTMNGQHVSNIVGVKQYPDIGGGL